MAEAPFYLQKSPFFEQNYKKKEDYFKKYSCKKRQIGV